MEFFNSYVNFFELTRNRNCQIVLGMIDRGDTENDAKMQILKI